MMPTPFHDFIDFVTCINQQQLFQKNYDQLLQKKSSLEQLQQASHDFIKKAEETVHTLKKQLDGFELELASLRKKEQDIEGKMERIANPREYSSLESEKEALSQKITTLENDTLVLLDRLEEEQKQLLMVKKTQEAKIQDYEKEIKTITDFLLVGEEELSHIKRTCSVKREQVRADWLAIFDNLKNSIQNPMVELKNGVCMGCFNKLPAQIISRVERRELCSCPMCGRLLYSVSSL